MLMGVNLQSPMTAYFPSTRCHVPLSFDTVTVCQSLSLRWSRSASWSRKGSCWEVVVKDMDGGGKMRCSVWGDSVKFGGRSWGGSLVTPCLRDKSQLKFFSPFFLSPFVARATQLASSRWVVPRLPFSFFDVVPYGAFHPHLPFHHPLSRA